MLMQITQELCKRPGLNKAGFEMPTIYIPTLLDKVTYILPYVFIMQWHIFHVQTFVLRLAFLSPCFIFNVVSLQPARCANQIEEVCKEIEKTINQTIQNILNTLEKDCERIVGLVDNKLAVDT